MAVADEFGYSVEIVSEFAEDEEAAARKSFLPSACAARARRHGHGSPPTTARRRLDYVRKTNVIAGEAAASRSTSARTT